MTTSNNDNSWSCPVPHSAGDNITLAHGEGSRLMRQLIRQRIVKSLGNLYLNRLADGATLPIGEDSLIMTTDSYVVSPIMFPGGDIGKLAVYGTVNDLAVMGADPEFMSLAFIMEEGLPMETFQTILDSIKHATQQCRVSIVTGDTKVVPRGAVDKLFINTTGVGFLRTGIRLGMQQIQPGDAILVNGTLGDHGMAIMAARENLPVESTLQSDCAPLHGLITKLFNADVRVKFLRDATRGGASAILHEICQDTHRSIILEEERIPVAEPVRGYAEILGLDPLYIANEGKMIVVVAAEDVDRALSVMRDHEYGKQSAWIGTVSDEYANQVIVRTKLGTLRVVDEPTGAPLPRIC